MSAVLAIVALGFVGDAPVDFNRQIRPILSDKCFRCHGFDAAARQADLRLDDRNDALRRREQGAPIVPGKPELSVLLSRIRAADPDMRMPPERSHKRLEPAEIALLERWIAEGAKYQEHWSFRRVEKPPIPKAMRRGWIQNPIDAFVLASLERADLSPAPAVDAATFCRRIFLDLVGLPPTPEEVDAFAVALENAANAGLHADGNPAVLALADRLLISMHYGERWGRHWLDQARYADSNGYTVDGPRVAWPYRDWVIRAIADGMPFDQFTVEQLAGDLLEHPSKAQLVATGFHRNTLINQEGGVKADQFRHEAIVDRVATTGAVWLGLTVGCAQCHTHKFDPISHVDYHRLYAVFSGCVDANNAGPTVDVYQGELFGLTATQQADLASLAGKRKELLALQAAEKAAGAASAEWSALPWRRADIKDYRTSSNASFRRLPDESLLADGNAAENDSYVVGLAAPTGKQAALRLRALFDDSLPRRGPGLAKNGNFILTDIELQVDGKPIRFAAAYADAEQAGYRAADAIDQDRATGWAINVSPANGANSKVSKVRRSSTGSDPRRTTAGFEAVFVLKEPLEFAKPIAVILRHDRNKNYLLGRFGLDWSVTAPLANSKPAQPAPPRLAQLRAEIAELEARLPGQGKPVQQMIARDTAATWEQYRFERGDFLMPDKKLGPLRPGVPTALAGPVPPRIRNRLDFARWLVHRDNPLTARVLVNRVWLHYFGRGLVATENDFGFQGTAPTHPELLDWLAADFMDHGWSLQRLHRMIVGSATYRQSSALISPSKERDPDNLLLARQVRPRLEAEVVRDLALAVAGLLDRRVGGPSVYPPQPADVFRFTQTVKPWPESQGGDRYRRTMYAAFFRSAPFPLLATFDVPDFCSACTSRGRSNTPLQALTLANDPLFVECAAGLARRAMAETLAASPAARIERMFRLCLARRPSPAEARLLAQHYDRSLAGVSKPALTAAESNAAAAQASTASALAAVARVLINLDEFITRN